MTESVKNFPINIVCGAAGHTGLLIDYERRVFFPASIVISTAGRVFGRNGEISLIKVLIMTKLLFKMDLRTRRCFEHTGNSWFSATSDRF